MNPKKITFVAMLLLLGLCSGCGERFTTESEKLGRALDEYLINENVCSSHQTCDDVVKIYVESGDRVYFNMYKPPRKDIQSKVIGFLVKEGLVITGGVPITLTVYPNSHDYYDGFTGIWRRKAILVLEIEQ